MNILNTSRLSPSIVEPLTLVMYTTFSRISVFISLVVVLSSCGKEDPSAPISFVQPKEGSTYTYDQYATDTLNALPIASSRDTTVATFMQVGKSLFGKTNVSMIITEDRNGVDTSYLNYEANGDVSMGLDPGSGQMVWITVPVSSRVPQSFSFTDTVVDGRDTAYRTVTWSVTYLATESMVVKGQTLSVEKCQSTASIDVTVVGSPAIRASVSQYSYYAPSIGYIVKTDVPVQYSPFDRTKEPGQATTLIDYELK